MRETLSPIKIYNLVDNEWRNHHGETRIPTSIAVIAVGVVLKESGGDTGTINVVHSSGPANGSRDRGLWQFNSYWHPEISDTVAFDKVQSTIAAYTVSNGFTSWGPWFGGGATSIEQEFNRTDNNQAAYALAVRTVSSVGSVSTVPTGNGPPSGNPANTPVGGHYTDPHTGITWTWDGYKWVDPNPGYGMPGGPTVTDPNATQVPALTAAEMAARDSAVAKLIAAGVLAVGDSVAKVRELLPNLHVGDYGLTAEEISALQRMIAREDYVTQQSANNDIFDNIPNLGDLGSGIVDVVKNIWAKISNVSFWKRIGLGALGVLILLLAIIVFTAKEVKA